MAKLYLFGRRRRRVTVAVYPGGKRWTFCKNGSDWQYHPRGSCAFPLSVAKAEARAEGAELVTEYR